MALSWKARHKAGGIYCAPACGFNCTRAAWEQAHAKGKALAKLLGPGWTYRVWENMGWHYNAISKGGQLQVSQYDDGTALAFLGTKGSAGGRWAEHGASPKAAVDAVLRVGRAALVQDLRQWGELLGIEWEVRTCLPQSQ